MLVHLYATSTVTAVAFETARRASAEGETCATVGAGAHVRDALGDYGQRIDEPRCVVTDGVTTVTVRGPTPARLVDAVGGALGLDRIERTARVRAEELRAPTAP